MVKLKLSHTVAKLMKGPVKLKLTKNEESLFPKKAGDKIDACTV